MKVLNLDNWCDEAKEIVPGAMYYSDNFIPRNKIMGVIFNLKPHDAVFLSAMPNLKFIASCTTGLDHIDTDYCKQKGIDIIYLDEAWKQNEGQNVYATAEHTWALIMSLIRKVPFAYNDVCEGSWNREAWQGEELDGKMLGIVGYGRVGQQIAKYAEAFGMKRMFHDIDKTTYFDIRNWSLKDVLKGSDIITVHIPLNESTYHMFSEKEFAIMKPTAYFVNTSRGAIVNESALIQALTSGTIKGAAIDVVQNEPNINNYLYAYAKYNNNLIITPHIAGNTVESRKKTQIYIANNIKEYIENDKDHR